MKLKEFRGPASVEVELDGRNNSLEEINNAVAKSRRHLAKILQ